MYQRSSKRRQLIARVMVYALMVSSVIALVTILTFVILGYSFNRKDGRIEQGGLLQFASVPSDATVTLDGAQVGSRTPSKASVDAKNHFVQMNLDGYRTWQKSIVVKAGAIGWLSYARLIPSDIKTEQLRSFQTIASSLASTDRHWIAIQEDAAQPTVTLANIESTTVRYTTLTVPSAIITTAATDAPQTYSMIDWGNGDDYLLIKRTYDTDKTEWFVVDRGSPEKSINLTTAYGINASDVQFGDRGGRNLFVLIDGVVRKINTDDKTLSSPLVENTQEFSVFDDSTIVYTSKPDEKSNNMQHVGYRAGDMQLAQTVFSYPATATNVHMAMSDYFGKRYVAVTHDSVMDVYSGTLPKGTTKASLKLDRTIALAAPSIRLSITQNGRFAVAQTADSFTTYDIELQKNDTTLFTKPTAAQRKLQWLDDYMVASDRAGILRFYEFDGANQQDILPVIEGQATSLSGDDKYMYAVTPAPNGVALTRVTLIIR